MPVISDKPLTRVCIRLWKEDYDKLKVVSETAGEIGVNKLIRQIIHSYVNQLNAVERQAFDEGGLR